MTLEIKNTVAVEDLRAILAKPRDIERAVAFSPEKFLTIVSSRDSTGGTLFEDGQPIVAGGLTRLDDKRAFVWLIACKDLRPYKDLVVPEVQSRLQKALDEGLTIYAHTTPGQEVAERFIRRLGFHKSDGANYWEMKK